MSSLYLELKRQAYEANMEIPKQNLAIYTFGNVSALDSAAGVFAIKPSGVPYSELSPDNMVLLDLEGKIVEGEFNPSSDTKTHQVLYRAFSNIKGICHTHSTYAVAWAQACLPIPVYGTTHADHLARPIPVTKVMSDEAIKNNYEEETGRQILAAMKDLDPKEVNMILVACHGPFTWGADAAKSVYNAKVLEEIATMAYLSRQINPVVSQIKDSLIKKHYNRKHGKDAYYGQKKES
jgi:L-ribulose-5-phosphate 4-epimerase